MNTKIISLSEEVYARLDAEKRAEIKTKVIGEKNERTGEIGIKIINPKILQK